MLLFRNYQAPTTEIFPRKNNFSTFQCTLHFEFECRLRQVTQKRNVHDYVIISRVCMHDIVIYNYVCGGS